MEGIKTWLLLSPRCHGCSSWLSSDWSFYKFWLALGAATQGTVSVQSQRLWARELTNGLCMCVVGECCDRWQSVAVASVPALHQTGDWQPAGWPQQHRQVQPVRIWLRSVSTYSSCLIQQRNTGPTSWFISEKVLSEQQVLEPKPAKVQHINSMLAEIQDGCKWLAFSDIVVLI